jgi:hypothetical protein
MNGEDFQAGDIVAMCYFDAMGNIVSCSPNLKIEETKEQKLTKTSYYIAYKIGNYWWGGYNLVPCSLCDACNIRFICYTGR